MSEDIRWKQRYYNFDWAFALLREALELKPENLSMLEKGGVIQRFDFTFELAWKTLKDYLEESGLILSPVTPRQVIKETFAAKVIASGDVWVNILDNRNLLSHTYDSSVFEQIVEAIAECYLQEMQDLHQFLAEKKYLRLGFIYRLRAEKMNESIDESRQSEITSNQNHNYRTTGTAPLMAALKRQRHASVPCNDFVRSHNLSLSPQLFRQDS